MPRITAAAINCSHSFERILATIKGRYKANFIREAQKAKKATVCSMFSPAALADEIETINKSMAVRSGGPMRPGYHRSADELRQAYRAEPDTRCRYHCSLWWGCFEIDHDADRHRASGLLAYLQLRRYGNLCCYSTLLGHGRHLALGVMPFLHLQVMEAVCSWLWPDEIDWLMYAGWHDGGRGLQLWKKKAGFEPVMFVLP